ncbi:MAG: hypothetical protein ACRD0U_00015 [Acidimicrobiales bacterium]
MVGITAIALTSWTPSRSRSEVKRLARERGLVLDAETLDRGARFYQAVLRGRVVGSAVALLPVMLAMRSHSSLTSVIHLCAIAAGGQLGAVIGLHWADRMWAGEVRVARLAAPRIIDYIPPMLRWWAGGMAGLVVIASGISVGAGDQRALSSAEVIGLAALAVAAVVGTEIACRLIVRTAQPAGSPTMLAVRDELKAEQLIMCVSFAGGICVVALIPLVFGWLPAPLLLPTFLGLGVFPLVMMDRRRRTWVRDHLWTAAR